ncbi:hypothetical protein LEMLEM_LOCUS4538 [Lemmus lemmus]
MAPAAGRESGWPAGGVRTVPVPRPLPLRAAYWLAGQGSRGTPNHYLPEVRRAPKGVSGARPRERAHAPAQRLCPPRDPGNRYDGSRRGRAGREVGGSVPLSRRVLSSFLSPGAQPLEAARLRRAWRICHDESADVVPAASRECGSDGGGATGLAD